MKKNLLLYMKATGYWHARQTKTLYSRGDKVQRQQQRRERERYPAEGIKCRGTSKREERYPGGPGDG